QRHVENGVALPEGLVDDALLVLGPIRPHLERCDGLRRGRRFDQALQLSAQSAAGGRLHFSAVCRQHGVERVRGGQNDLGQSGGGGFGELRREHVLQIVRKLAQFVEAARSRVTL